MFGLSLNFLNASITIAQTSSVPPSNLSLTLGFAGTTCYPIFNYVITNEDDTAITLDNFVLVVDSALEIPLDGVSLDPTEVYSDILPLSRLETEDTSTVLSLYFNDPVSNERILVPTMNYYISTGPLPDITSCDLYISGVDIEYDISASSPVSQTIRLGYESPLKNLVWNDPSDLPTDFWHNDEPLFLNIAGQNYALSDLIYSVDTNDLEVIFSFDIPTSIVLGTIPNEAPIELILLHPATNEPIVLDAIEADWHDGFITAVDETTITFVTIEMVPTMIGSVTLYENITVTHTMNDSFASYTYPYTVGSEVRVRGYLPTISSAEDAQLRPSQLSYTNVVLLLDPTSISLNGAEVSIYELPTHIFVFFAMGLFITTITHWRKKRSHNLYK